MTLILSLELLQTHAGALFREGVGHVSHFYPFPLGSVEAKLPFHLSSIALSLFLITLYFPNILFLTPPPTRREKPDLGVSLKPGPDLGRSQGMPHLSQKIWVLAPLFAV